jgi:F0F1-type ATP synthase membrane subunit b/b'
MIADLQQQLGIDSSFFSQFIIFVFAFLWLKFFFFTPFLGLINKREGQSDGLSDEAAKLEEEAVRLEVQYQSSLSATRKSAYAERETVLAAARKVAAEKVHAARAEAKSKIDQGRESSRRTSEGELAGLKGQVSSISSLLVEKLMNTKVGL